VFRDRDDEVAHVGIAGTADPGRLAHSAVVAVGGDQALGADGARPAPPRATIVAVTPPCRVISKP
jgi:hypothetical protein